MNAKPHAEPAAVLPPEDNTHIGKVVAPPPKPAGALKYILIAVSVLFVVLMLVLPLAAVVTGALREGLAFYWQALTARYKITDMSLRGQALLEAVCRGRGFLLRGGELDIERASAVVLDEFRDGRLGRLTLEAPPEPAEKAPVENKENNENAQ